MLHIGYFQVLKKLLKDGVIAAARIISEVCGRCK